MYGKKTRNDFVQRERFMMEREIMKALVVRDVDMLRTIFMLARQGKVSVKPSLMDMLYDYITKFN